MPLNPTTTFQQDDVMSKDRMNTYVLRPISDMINPPFAYYNKPITDPALTVTSTSFVPIDATNFSLTITTKGNPVLLTARIEGVNNTLAAVSAFEIFINGSAYGGGANGIWGINQYVANNIWTMSLSEIIPLAPNTWNFQIYARVSAGTLTMGASYFPQFSVREL